MGTHCPQQQGRSNRFSLLIRMIHKVLNNHAVNAKRTERGKECRICRRVIDQAVIAWSEIARRKNTNDKGQQLVRHFATDDPSGIFYNFILSERLQQSLQTPSPL